MFWLKKWEGSIGFALSKLSKMRKARKNQRTFIVFGVEFTIPRDSEFWIAAEEIVPKGGYLLDWDWEFPLKDKYISHKTFCYICYCPSGMGSTGWLVKFSGERHVIDDKLFLSKISRLARIKKLYGSVVQLALRTLAIKPHKEK